MRAALELIMKDLFSTKDQNADNHYNVAHNEPWF